jgi:hypothetical protein
MKQDRRSFFKFFGAAVAGGAAVAKSAPIEPAKISAPVSVTPPPMPSTGMAWSIDPSMRVASTVSTCFNLPARFYGPLNVNIGLHARGVQ